MESGTRNLLIASSVIGIGGLIYYFASQRSIGGSTGARLFGIRGEIDYIGRYKVNGLTGNWLHLENESRIKLKGKVQRGNLVRVKGTAFDDIYEIKSVWVDSNGNTGAILLNPDIPYTPKSSKDLTFKGATLIFK